MSLLGHTLTYPRNVLLFLGSLGQDLLGVHVGTSLVAGDHLYLLLCIDELSWIVLELNISFAILFAGVDVVVVWVGHRPALLDI